MAWGLPQRNDPEGKESGRVGQAGGSCCRPSHGKLQHPPPPSPTFLPDDTQCCRRERPRCVDAVFRHVVALHNGESCSHLTDDETEVQGRGQTHPRSQVTKRGFEPKQSDSQRDRRQIGQPTLVSLGERGHVDEVTSKVVSRSDLCWPQVLMVTP